MADETQTENKPDSNSVTISIAEFNQLTANKAKLELAENQLREEKNKYTSLQSEHEALKLAKKSTGPSKEEIEQQVRQEIAAELDEVKGKATNYEGQLRKMIITDKVMSLLAGKLTPSAEKFLRYEIEKECDIEGDFQNPTIIVKDQNGNPVWSKSSMNQKMGADEYVNVLEERYPDFFKSSTRSGESGNKPNNTTSPSMGGDVSWSKAEKMSTDELKKLGPAALDNLLKQL